MGYFLGMSFFSDHIVYCYGYCVCNALLGDLILLCNNCYFLSIIISEKRAVIFQYNKVMIIKLHCVCVTKAT